MAPSNKPAASDTKNVEVNEGAKKEAPNFNDEVTREQADKTVAREHNDPLDTRDRNLDPQSDESASGTIGNYIGDVNAATAPASVLEKANPPRDAERVQELGKEYLYNPNAGLSPRVGGPYLDNLEMEEAEKRRAVFENREPNYDNMAGSAGVTLQTAGQLAAAFNGGPALAQMIEDNAENERLGPRPVGDQVVVGTNVEAIEASQAEREARRKWDNTKVSSHDQPGVVFTDPSASHPGGDTKVETKK